MKNPNRPRFFRGGVGARAGVFHTARSAAAAAGFVLCAWLCVVLVLVGCESGLRSSRFFPYDCRGEGIWFERIRDVYSRLMGLNLILDANSDQVECNMVCHV